MEKQVFINRLTELRNKKGVSARDMSLSLGQSPGYINNIENGINLPSMTLFFYICDYFHITPKDFFDFDNADPDQASTLYEEAKSLDSEKMSHLIAIVKAMK